MTRLSLALGVVVLIAGFAPAAEPKPLWEIDLGVAEKRKGFIAPGWLGVSPDGKSIAAVVVEDLLTGGSQFTLHVWDAATRKERFTAKLDVSDHYSVSAALAAFAPDNTIVTAGRKLVVRSLADGKEIATRDIRSGGPPDLWVIADVKECFHVHRPADSDLGATELHFGPIPTAEPVAKPEVVGRAFISVHSDYDMRPRPVALSPDGTRLVAGHREFKDGDTSFKFPLRLFSVKTFGRFAVEPIVTVDRPHPGVITALAFSRDGKTLATGSDDSSIGLWDVSKAGEKWKPTSTLRLGDFRVFACAFNPEGKTLAAVTYDKKKPSLYLIDVVTAKVVRSVQLGREQGAVAWSPDGKMLLTGSYAGKVQAWDATELLKAE